MPSRMTTMAMGLMKFCPPPIHDGLIIVIVLVVMMMLVAPHLSMIAERLFSATSFFSFFAPTGSSMINIAWMKKEGSWVVLETF